TAAPLLGPGAGLRSSGLTHLRLDAAVRRIEAWFALDAGGNALSIQLDQHLRAGSGESAWQVRVGEALVHGVPDPAAGHTRDDAPAGQHRFVAQGICRGIVE